jgi:hypothetical protein
MIEYQHDWLHLMPPKALVLTATDIFLTYKVNKIALCHDYPSEAEELDAVQILWDELCDLVGVFDAHDMIFHAPGMSQELCDEFMELVE